MVVGYKCNYRKFLGFIATKGAGSNEPGDPYLCPFRDIFSKFSVCPVVHPQFLVRYFNACNVIDNQNIMRKSDLALEKIWVTQSDYLRLVTTVTLCVGIIDGKLLSCHGISEGSMEKKITMREYNNRTIMTNSSIPFQLIVAAQL